MRRTVTPRSLKNLRSSWIAMNGSLTHMGYVCPIPPKFLGTLIICATSHKEASLWLKDTYGQGSSGFRRTLSLSLEYLGTHYMCLAELFCGPLQPTVRMIYYVTDFEVMGLQKATVIRPSMFPEPTQCFWNPSFLPTHSMSIAAGTLYKSKESL